MGKLQEFDITFTNNKVVYGPGESISGTVKIRTTESLHFKGKLSVSETQKTERSVSSSQRASLSQAQRGAHVGLVYINSSSVMVDVGESRAPRSCGFSFSSVQGTTLCGRVGHVLGILCRCSGSGPSVSHTTPAATAAVVVCASSAVWYSYQAV